MLFWTKCILYVFAHLKVTAFSNWKWFDFQFEPNGLPHIEPTTGKERSNGRGILSASIHCIGLFCTVLDFQSNRIDPTLRRCESIFMQFRNCTLDRDQLHCQWHQSVSGVPRECHHRLGIEIHQDCGSRLNLLHSHQVFSIPSWSLLRPSST